MKKRVYFYDCELRNVNLNEKAKGLKSKILNIIDQYSTVSKNCRVIDLKPKNSQDKIMADIFEYRDDHLFMRVCKQKASNSFIKRNYITKTPNNLLEDLNEEKEGIEMYTYIYLHYETEILAIINQMGAPTYRVLNYLFEEYNNNYCLEMNPIPNFLGINLLFGANSIIVKKFDLESVHPTALFLKEIAGFKDNEVIDSIDRENIKISIEIKSADKKGLDINKSSILKIIEGIQNEKDSLDKAKIRAKADNQKIQDYNFFEENFTYSVEINTYKIQNSHRINFSADELVSIYRDNLIMSFQENKDLLLGITGKKL